MLKITAAAAYAGCSKRYVERVLAKGEVQMVYTTDGFKEFSIQRDASGRIDADILRQLVISRLKEPFRPGRRITTRYRVKRVGGVKQIRERNDAWRLERTLTLIKGIRDNESLDIIARTALEQAGHRLNMMPA